MFCFKCIKKNEIVSKFLLAGDKFMPEMHLKQAVKKLKSLSRLEIQILFTEMGLIKPVFSMIWLMVNQKTWQKKKKNSIRQSFKR